MAHRLERTLLPRHYDILLAPDLATATFRGQVTISAVATAPTREVVMNAMELDIHSATVVAGDRTGEAVVRLEPEAERLHLELPGDPVEGEIEVSMTFSGTLNDRLHGFYRSTFLDDAGSTRTIATTQFEATDARRAFPCFDEPDLKATFSITLEVPAGLSGFSNSPVISEEVLDNGSRLTRFATTIPMSTYLVAFVVGPLEASEAEDVDGVPVRVVHVPGKDHLTSFAHEVAAHALRFFTEFFGIPYPAEKLDLLAIPDFAFGAMENLGCVTFRESVLLVDPANASRLELERVADVISHEIAHMWFGDLVTMRWWNGIWLNEAFATLMELLCVDHFRPEWKRWTSFGVERESAMDTDSLHSTRPVEYPVGPPEEAQGMFDVLTYQKGGSVLRMLQLYLGTDVFREGIRRYLSSHRFSNTDTEDLWSALAEASGEPVGQMMDTWIRQGGFPLVELEQTPSELRLTQAPFSYGPPEGDSAIGDRWVIPLMTRRLGGDPEPDRHLLEAAHLSLGAGDSEVVVVNAHGAGFYRVGYPRGLLGHMRARFGELDVLEQFNLLGDTWAGVIAGRYELDDFLALAGTVDPEGDPELWSLVAGAASLLDHVLPEEAREYLAAYTREILNPVLAIRGFEAVAGEDERIGSLRSTLVSTLGTIGRDPLVRKRCAQLQEADESGGAPLDPNLASGVLGVVAATGGAAQFDYFLDRQRGAPTPQVEMRYLYALAAFEDPSLAMRAFDLAATEIRTQNAPFVIQLLLANRACGAVVWEQLRDRFEELAGRFPANILPRMLGGLRLLAYDRDLASQIQSFLKEHPLPSGQRTVDQVAERLGVNAAFGARISSSAASCLARATERAAGKAL